MSAAWFYNHRGRLQGPFEADNILEKIKAGELGPDDLVYQEGEDKWQPISSFQQFSKALPSKTAEEKKKASEERQWVVLERKKGKANKQLGPYSTDEMKAMISRGELKLSSYVWRTGMKEWYRVQAFQELIEDPVSIPETPTVPDIPSDIPETTQTSTQLEEAEESELKNVVQIKFKEITAVEPMPEDAEGADLTESKADPRDMENMETRVNYRIRPDALKRVHKSIESGNIIIEFIRDMLSGAGARWIAAAIALALVVVLARGAFNRINQISKGKPKVAESAAAKPQNIKRSEKKREVPQNKVAAVEPEVSPTPVPTAVPDRKATYVRISHDPKTGVLKVSTDATSQYRVTLTFTSVFGKILKNSYFRKLVRKEREMDLRELNWPRGYYRVEARIGEFSSDATVFVGSGKNFTQELRGFKKRMTLDFINERVAFIKTAERLVDKATVFAMILRAGDNAQAWRRDYGPWRRSFGRTSHPILRGIGPKSRSRYVMAEMWLDLKQARRDLDKFTKSMSKKSRRTSSLSQKELGDIRNRLTKLAAKAQGLSLWR